MYEQFQQIEQEYYTLRGQFSVGRLTAEEFDAALHSLQVQDARGRIWMIGANTGNWYYSEDGGWHAGNPFQADTVSKPPPEVDAVPPAPIGRKEPDPLPGRGIALPFLASAVILMLVAGIAFFLFRADTTAGPNSAGLPTRIVPPTRIALQPTAPLTSTPTRTATPRVTSPAGATLIPITVTPPALVLEPTDAAPVLTTIPTITPGAFGGNASTTQNDDGSFEDTSFNPTPDSGLSTGLPPDVYVTDLRVSPNPPAQRQPATFTVSFLNTNPQSVGLEWRVVIMNPNKPGRNKDWGESQLVGITIPPGRSEFSLTYTPVTNSGPCIPLQALVARSLDDNGRFLLPGIRGGQLITNLTFC